LVADENNDMTAYLSKLATEALALPEEDRAFIAHKLISSLDKKSENGVAGAWRKEIDKRSSDISTGKATCRDSSMVVGQIRKKLHASHSSSSRR